MATRAAAALWVTRAMAGFQIAVGLFQAISPIEGNSNSILKPSTCPLIPFLYVGAAGFLGTRSFDQSTASTLMRAVAGRNLASGVVMAVLTLTGQTKTAGAMMVCGLITQACDIIACAEIGGVWKGHAFLAPVTATIGLWVMNS